MRRFDSVPGLLYSTPMSYIEEFLEYIVAEGGRAFNSYAAYKSDLLSLEKYLRSKHRQELQDAKDNEINLYITNLHSEISPRSICRKISSIKHFYQFLVTEKIIDKNPTENIISPKYTKKLPRALSVNEIKSLLEECRNMNSQQGLRLELMISLLYDTGMRISEMLSIKLSDLGFANSKDIELKNYFSIVGKGSKERIVIINNYTKLLLEKYIGNYCSNNYSKQYLFSSNSALGHMTRQNFDILIKKIANLASLNEVSAHKLRHSFATHMLENGSDLRVLQELLGHSDISSTQIYTHMDKKHLKNLLQSKHPMSSDL